VSDFLDQIVQGLHVQLAFERMSQTGLASFGNDQVGGLGPYELDVGAGGIEMRVVGDDVSLLRGNAEKDTLRGPALVAGNDVLVTEDILYRVAEMIEAATPGIAFVAFPECGPLVTPVPESVRRSISTSSAGQKQ
jgi:hypothetical protein